MARTYLTDINLTGNEIQNVSLQKLDQAPSTPVRGQMYFNKTDNHIYECTAVESNTPTWKKIAYYDDVTGGFKPLQTAVSDPTASGNSYSFIDSISQDANGVITVTKKTVPDASTSTKGVIKIGTSATDAAAGNHAHGNITNSGTITSDTSVATGDKLVIIDNDNNKVARSGISFDTSSGNSNKFLAKDGTWQEASATLSGLTDVSLNIPIGNRDVLRWVEDTWVNSPETSLSLGTTEGTGNAITGLSVAGHEITLEKSETFLTDHQSIKTLDTTATTAQTTSASEAIAGSGTITLHKVSKTGSYNDLLNKPTIPVDTNQKVKVGQTTFNDNAVINLAAASGSNLTVTGSIIAPESITFGVESGYSIPSTTDQSTWSGKQDALTFDSTPTASSTNPVESGGIYEFVNSSIENVAAYYITKNAAGDPFTTKAELNAATTYYSGGSVRVPTRNDYCIVLNDESQAIEIPGYTAFTAKTDYIGFYILVGSTYTKVTDSNVESLSITPGTTKAYELPTTRYINTSSTSTPTWSFQYIVNNSGLTAAQVAAINSGINASLVSKITDVNDGKFSVTVVTGQGTASDSASNIFSANQSSNTGVTLHIPASPSDIGAQPAGNYKTTQIAKTDPTASGTSTTFIDSITQNENGEITATKKTVVDEKLALTSVPTSMSTSGTYYDVIVTNDSDDTKTDAKTRKYTSYLRYKQSLSGISQAATLNIGSNSSSSITPRIELIRGSYVTTIEKPNTSHTNTLTLPTSTGTLALTSDIPANSDFTLAGLSDTDTTGVNDHDALVYDSTTSKWVPSAVSGTDEKLALTSIPSVSGYDTVKYDILATPDDDATKENPKTRKYSDEVKVLMEGWDNAYAVALEVGGNEGAEDGYIRAKSFYGDTYTEIYPTGINFGIGDTAGTTDYIVNLNPNSSTADNISLTLPSTSGTLALTSDIYPSAVCYLKINNVALTSTLGVCTWSISSTATFTPTLPTGKKADFTTAIVSVREVSTGNEVYCDVNYSANTLTIKINSASNIAAGTYIAVIHTGLVSAS